MSTAEPVRQCGGGDRRQQVQGGERPGQELPPRQAAETADQVEASIERYLSALETADRQEGELAAAKLARRKDKIASLQELMPITM